MVFIEGDANMRPWSKNARKVLYIQLILVYKFHKKLFKKLKNYAMFFICDVSFNLSLLN